jgi:hypothetical protein
MPPRKNPPTADAALQQQQQVTASFEGIEAFELPRALVTRIAKSGVRLRDMLHEGQLRHASRSCLKT